MVQLSGKTYRIMKVGARSYEVIRILDDVRIGRFEVTPRLEVQPEGVTRELLWQIALTALKEAKLSWMPPRRPRAPRVPVPPIRRDSQGLV
jgi:hypothetical protein